MNSIEPDDQEGTDPAKGEQSLRGAFADRIRAVVLGSLAFAGATLQHGLL